MDASIVGKCLYKGVEVERLDPYFMERQNTLKKEYFRHTEALLDAAFERALHSALRTSQSFEEKIFLTIWNFMQSRRIRRRNYMTEDDKSRLKNSFLIYAKNQYKNKLPITFYIFDLPMKNGVKQDTDLGEEIMLKNFENIACRIENIYPYGVRFIILSDGDIFSLSGVIPHEYIDKYIKNINDLIKKLSLTRVSIIDWHLLVYKDEKNIDNAFLNFKNSEKYETYLSREIENKTKIRYRELAGDSYSKHTEQQLLFARAFFEKNKKDYFNSIKHNFGFKLTKGGFKRDEPVLAIYPADPNIEISVSRGITQFIKKESGIILPTLLTKTNI